MFLSKCINVIKSTSFVVLRYVDPRYWSENQSLIFNNANPRTSNRYRKY